MQVSEIMHKGLITASINDTVKKVAEIMRQEDIGAVPIVEDNRAVGIVTDRDIVLNCIAEGYPTERPVAHAMSEDVICVREEDNVTEAALLMEDNQISRLVVVDENKKPTGMLSLKDLTEGQDDEENGEVLTHIKQ